MNDRPEWSDEHGSRRIPPQSLRVTAEPQTIRIDFDRARAVRRIRIGLRDQTLGDYPRKLVVEAVDGASVRGLYNGNPLGPVMRALLIQPVQPSIEIGLPANVSRMLVLRESGQAGSWNWSNHEVACFEESSQLLAPRHPR